MGRLSLFLRNILRVRLRLSIVAWHRIQSTSLIQLARSHLTHTDRIADSDNQQELEARGWLLAIAAAGGCFAPLLPIESRQGAPSEARRDNPETPR